MSCGSILPGTWLGLQVHCCCRGGPVPPFTWLSVSVPGAAEKPYMVEEAVSYNELDYISVSTARAGSPGEPEASGGSVFTCLGVKVPGASQWGVFVSLGSVLDSEPLRLGELSVMPLPVPPLWLPTLLMSLHGQQSDH